MAAELFTWLFTNFERRKGTEMTIRLTRALAAVAAVTALGTWVSAGPARAWDGRGPYDQGSGQWYADEARDHARLGYDAYGAGRARDSRPPYPWDTGTSYGGYQHALPGPGYYSGAPTPDLRPSADYSYGAYAPPAPGRTARVRLIVPSDARVWFGDAATRQTGLVRDFESPELAPGRDYSYDVEARWVEDGRVVTRTRRVDVRANSSVTVDFMQQ
jgi:uncharacterized protein (TIGR03000 family)